MFAVKAVCSINGWGGSVVSDLSAVRLGLSAQGAAVFTPSSGLAKCTKLIVVASIPPTSRALSEPSRAFL